MKFLITSFKHMRALSSALASMFLLGSSMCFAQTPTYVQAESYSNMSGVVVGPSTSEGGQVVGSIDTNDWMTFNNINIPSSGSYTIAYRVASLNGGGSARFEEAGGATLYATTGIPKTSGWDTWTTVYQTVNLSAGNHNFGIKAGIGGWNLNWFSITSNSTASSTPNTSSSRASSSTPSGGSFAPKTKVLNYLNSISGNHTLVGIENKNAQYPTSDSDKITAITGRQSSFWGADFGFGSFAVDNRQTVINEARNQWAKGVVVALMYHACSPTQNEYCTWDDIGGAHPIHLTNDQWIQLTTPGTALYNTWISRLNTLAVYFQQLKDAGVAPLFRPFHEMNQCVFWWSCKTGSNGSARLYQITHDYLTYTKGLTNIIWVWNVQDFTSLSSDVYTYNPGSQYFDIASLDVYNTGYTSGNYNAMLNVAGGKPIAIAECQFMPTSSLLSQQPRWTYAMLWPDFISNNQNTIKALYNAGNVITLDEMPKW